MFKYNKTIKSRANLSFGITQVSDIDTYGSIMEKLNDAINRANNSDIKGRIEIET